MPRRIELEVGGMGCDHCVAGVRSALEAVPGVRVEEVAIGSARVVVEESSGADVGTLEEAVRKAGYEPKRVGESERDAL
jgi:copper chaperone CopZ